MNFPWRKVVGVLIILVFLAIQVAYWFNPIILKDVTAFSSIIFRSIHDYPVISALLFIAGYAASIVFGIPVSITILGGYFFNGFLGTLYSLIGIVLGSLILCLLVRFVFKEWIQEKYMDEVKQLSNNLKKYGGLYILIVQAIPFGPSFFPYIAMGLSDMPITRIVIINLLASFPLTVTYALAGSYLKSIDSIENFVFYISIFGGLLLVIFLGVFGIRKAMSVD